MRRRLAWRSVAATIVLAVAPSDHELARRDVGAQTVQGRHPLAAQLEDLGHVLHANRHRVAHAGHALTAPERLADCHPGQAQPDFDRHQYQHQNNRLGA